MALLVLAYPVLSSVDYQSIQNFRKKNDELYYNVVEPHFTIIFPVFDSHDEDFIQEISDLASSEKSFKFALRCATISKDAFTDCYHTFLVPDEGYSNIVKLHDKLYSSLLKNNQRLDIDYIPHIGVGNSPDKHVCKKMVDEWNAMDFSIPGQVDQLTIVKFENNSILHLKEIPLH